MHTVLRGLYYLGGRVLLLAPKASLFEGGGFAKQRRREFSSSNPGRRSYWLGPATTTTAACGRNREELLGPWPAGCKAHSRAVAYAGSHNPSRGEGCPEGERGESKHPSHPLAQRSDPGGDAPCKRHQTCPTRPPSVREATVRCRFSPRFPTLRIFFFCNFLRDFRLIFRWKAVVDSVQFRVILNITTKRFDAEAISNRSPNQRKEPDLP